MRQRQLHHPPQTRRLVQHASSPLSPLPSHCTKFLTCYLSPQRCDVLQHSTTSSPAHKHILQFFIHVHRLSVYRSCDVRVGRSVQCVSMANDSLHKLILKLIPQDKGHACIAHQTPLSFNWLSLYLSPCLQWPCPPALHSLALLSKHQSEVSR